MKHRTTHEKYQEIAELVALKSCCEEFAAEMQQTLVEQHEAGRRGWDDDDWSDTNIKKQLIEHIKKGDMVDVGIFAMFYWNRQ